MINYENKFLISNLGRIISLQTYHLKKEPLLKQQINSSGYYVLSVCKKSMTVHRLVWETFNGPIPRGFQINHKNSIRDDNRLENLEVVTPKQNMTHAVEFNGMNRGEKAPANILNENQVREIKILLKNGEKGRNIAKIYNVADSTISAIKHNVNWSWLD